jgi:large subunit ribosomal protein L21
MFAIIRTGGKQYKVTQGLQFRVEKLDATVGAKIVLDQVLLVGDGAKTTIGTPMVSGAKVTAEVISQMRDDKVIVFKKKRRANYRRTKGHRQALTVLKITEIKAA